MKSEQIFINDKDILGGVPVFRGTRVPVQSLVGHLKAGETIEDFLEGFPSISRKQAQVFLEIAHKEAS
jgi:uncharacterized protein (DUF433 family)